MLATASVCGNTYRRHFDVFAAFFKMSLTDNANTTGSNFETFCVIQYIINN